MLRVKIHPKLLLRENNDMLFLACNTLCLKSSGQLPLGQWKKVGSEVFYRKKTPQKWPAKNLWKTTECFSTKGKKWPAPSIESFFGVCLQDASFLRDTQWKRVFSVWLKFWILQSSGDKEIACTISCERLTFLCDNN